MTIVSHHGGEERQNIRRCSTLVDLYVGVFAMGCYSCQGPDGTESTLCPACRVTRAERDISIRSSINKKNRGLLDYAKVLRDEWLVVVGVIVMIAASINALFWVFYGSDRAMIDAPWAKIPPEEIYHTCMAKAPLGDISEINFDEIQQGYPNEVAQFLKENEPHGVSRADIIRHVMTLRLQESCAAARQTCASSPTSEECRRFAEAYVL